MKEVARQFPQGLVSGQILFNISNNDIGLKDKNVVIKLADIDWKHL